MPDDVSARPTSGRPVAQQLEDEMAVEKERSTLKLEDTVNRFLPEQQMHDFRQKPETEIVEQLKRLTASQETEIQQLRKLATDLDRRLTSGFYPTPYVGQGRPPTPGVAAGPEIHQPEVRLYDRYGDTYDAYHYRPSFYSPPRYSSMMQL